jgi:hypothetical protein
MTVPPWYVTALELLLKSHDFRLLSKAPIHIGQFLMAIAL